MHQYFAFDLSIQSELELPELLESKTISAPANVNIAIGQVPNEGIKNARQKTTFFQANEKEFWFHIKGVARYLIVNGQDITIEPYPFIDEASIRVYLLGSCFGALLMQRGFTLIHGNAIQVGQNAITFAGHSGIGKSTLTALLKQEGYPILADDVCAINEMGEVVPSYPQIKLWADMAKYLEIDTRGLRKIRPHIEKFAWPTHESFCNKKRPLKQIYILSSHEKTTFEINTIYGSAKLKYLKEYTYRPQYLSGLGLSKKHALKCVGLAQQVRIKSLVRPENQRHMKLIIDAIEQDLKADSLNRSFSAANEAI